VLSASELDDKIAWYENNGSETFSAHTITTSANGAYSVYATDVDGDGDVDVLSASYADEKIAWYENNGLTSGVRSVSVGTQHTCALTTLGAVKCWGANTYGQLGDGTTTNSSSPVDVSGLSAGVQAVVAGGYHTCALTFEDGVKCWGINTNGQLGDGTTTNRSTPVAVSGLSSGVGMITAGSAHTCALLTSDSVQCWGNNAYGSLGDSSSTQRTAPAAVSSVSGSATFTDVPTSHWGFRYIETLYANGYTAGCNTSPLKYCPDNTMNRAEIAVFVERGIHGAGMATPAQPTSSSNVFTDISLGPTPWYAKWAVALWDDGYTAGCSSSPRKYCPLQGHTRAEGSVFYLRMLNGVSHSPTAATGLFTDMATSWWGAKWGEAAFQAGLIKECTIDPTRTFCPNNGLDRALAAYMMVKAKDLPLTTISASGDHTCLRTPAGTVKCWGYNSAGQVGDASTANRNSPADVVN
jgi:hypothetical protein